MGDVVELRPQRVTTDEYLGCCPECGKNDGFLNVGRDHWAYCRRHKTRWLVGSNLFSGWRHEDETVWLCNRYRLEECRVVDPICPEPTEEERRLGVVASGNLDSLIPF